MSEAYQSGASTEIHHAPNIRQQGMLGDFFSVQAYCSCNWHGQVYSGQVGWDSGTMARRRAELDVQAHRRVT